MKENTLYKPAAENEITDGGEKNSFFFVSISPTSITVNVKYPLDIGIWGNRLLYYDKTNRIWKPISGVDYYTRNGIYTLNRLTPGIKYRFYYNYFDHLDKSWGVPKYIDVQTPILSEKLIACSRRNMDFELDEMFTDVLGNELTNRFLDDIDRGFTSMYELVNGDVTYSGGRMKLQHVRNLPALTEAADGQTIKWQLCRDLANGYASAAIDHAMSMKALNASTTEAPLHEISHNFDNEKWNFDAEALAVLKVYYYYSVTNRSMALSNQSSVFTGAEYKEYIKNFAARNAGNLSYDSAMTQNIYSSYSLAYTLAEIADRIGWNAFTQTFTYFYNLPDKSVPPTKLGKLTLFLRKLEEFSGQAVFSELTAKEDEVYSFHFEGSIAWIPEPDKPDKPNEPSRPNKRTLTTIIIRKDNNASEDNKKVTRITFWE